VDVRLNQRKDKGWSIGMASEKRRKERNLLSGTLLGGQDLLMRDSAKEKALFRDPAGKRRRPLISKGDIKVKSMSFLFLYLCLPSSYLFV
jgi:hypothetical protein